LSIWFNGIQPRFRTIDGLSIRFAQSEQRDDHALLLSPWPESLFAFEPTWASLAEDTHLVAIDLPGFGHSQRRDELLSPQAMGEFVIRVADAFDLASPHVIGPDVGTTAVLFAAARHPDRLRSLIVGGGPAAIPLQLGGALKDWVEVSDVERYRRGDPRQIVAGILAGIERYALLDFVREDYPPTKATDSPSRCATCAATPPMCRCLAICCHRSRHRCRSSPGPETRWCQR
jgi:pimeloyl-ACP methyl ester carboxylesterase